ncbi:MAG: hypothetical protein L0207_00005, partial [Chlamydiae bacterium]|nr:hypothetical protein [Chlamydiota bacterium]
QERKNLVSNIMIQSENAIRMFYLCRKILADANISISGKDIPIPPSEPLEIIVNPNKTLHDPRHPDVKQAEAFSRTLIEKAEDWVIAHAKKD